MELIEAELPPRVAIAHPGPAVAAMEQHILLRAGVLDVTHAGESWRLGPEGLPQALPDGADAAGVGAGGGILPHRGGGALKGIGHNGGLPLGKFATSWEA
jgi:hypothetical protein